MWPFAKRQKKLQYQTEFQRLVESVIKEDCIENETFEHLPDIEMAQVVCHEMKNLGILSLKHENIDKIIVSNRIIDKYSNTNISIIEKQHKLAELMLSSIMTRQKSWSIKRHNDSVILFFLKNNDSIYVKYNHKCNINEKFNFSFFGNIFYLRMIDVRHREITHVGELVPSFKNALKFGEHIFNTPKIEQITLAKQLLRT